MTTIKMPLDKFLNPIPVLKMGKSTDVVDGEITTTSEIVRVAALTDIRIGIDEAINDSGVYMPAGAIEYFYTSIGGVIAIQGEANITNVI